MIKRMTMELFVEKFAKKDLVAYEPQDLKRGDPIWVFDQGLWEPAMFIGEYHRIDAVGDLPSKCTAITAILDSCNIDNGYNLHVYDSWVSIKPCVVAS